MKDINLKDINWNKLDLESFSAISDKLNSDLKREKKATKAELSSKPIVVNIDNFKYEIKYSDYIRYKSIKSLKAKNKFKEFVKTHYQPLMEL